MRIVKSLGMAGVAVVLAAAFSLPASAELANAALKDKSGKPIGEIDLVQTQAGVLLKVTVKGVEPGEHAFHVHAVGKCEAPFDSAAQPHTRCPS